MVTFLELPTNYIIKSMILRDTTNPLKLVRFFIHFLHDSSPNHANGKYHNEYFKSL